MRRGTSERPVSSERVKVGAGRAPRVAGASEGAATGTPRKVRAGGASRAADGAATYGPAAIAWTRAPVTAARVRTELEAVVRWYFVGDGPGAKRSGTPFYCDPDRVGAFAVEPEALAAGDEAALFRLFVTLSMYQALRDVVIMRRQRELPVALVETVAGLSSVSAAVERHRCEALRTAATLAGDCSVGKRAGRVDCERRPGAACAVKDATRAFGRMGDMGKLPASAWLGVWREGGVGAALAAVCRETADPAARAHAMVERLGRVHRVGRKLATLYVSALATPHLAPGLTPWFPALDGHDLVVVDTNVARAIDALRPPGAPRTYDARADWLRAQAARVDLRRVRGDLPVRSPRLVQEALYAFGSRSNRTARGDGCATGAPCGVCTPRLCPFAPRSLAGGPRRAAARSRFIGRGHTT